MNFYKGAAAVAREVSIEAKTHVAVDAVVATFEVAEDVQMFITCFKAVCHPNNYFEFVGELLAHDHVKILGSESRNGWLI